MPHQTIHLYFCNHIVSIVLWLKIVHVLVGNTIQNRSPNAVATIGINLLLNFQFQLLIILTEVSISKMLKIPSP